MTIFLVLLAAVPLVVVSLLMVLRSWSASRAMPVGFFSALVIAAIWWSMPLRWIAAAAIAGIINTIDILIIVYGAVLLLQLMMASGGIQGIALTMTQVSKDRRIQLIVIAWLMGGFLEAAAGFGTPAAVGAPLLVGMGFPPLVAAIATLIGDSAPVTFGAVGVPIWGGFASIRELMTWPVTVDGTSLTFPLFLGGIATFSAILHLCIGSFIPLVMVAVMTKITTGSFAQGLKAWPAALLAGLLFMVPQAIIASFVGPELPALIGSLVGLAIFVPLASRGILMPKDTWDLPHHSTWPKAWEGTLQAGAGQPQVHGKIGPLRAWMPYLIIGALLLVTRMQFFGVTPLLRQVNIGWEGILGTTIGRSVQPLYNPGIFPFIAVALIIPLLHGLPWKVATQTWHKTLVMVQPAAVALVFALGMVYIMINSGEAAGRDSMLIVMANAAAHVAGSFWYLFAPLIGALGSFISGSNTVSNIMFGPFQFGTAASADLAVIPVLALQAVGGAAGNMICIHNVVAVLTTVGLIGREGVVIRSNLGIGIAYCVLAGIISWIIVSLLAGGIFLFSP